MTTPCCTGFVPEPDLDEVRGVLRRLAAQPTPVTPSYADLQAERSSEAAAPVQPGFDDESLPGPAGPIPVRRRTPDAAVGVAVNLHMGGWVRGRAAITDALCAQLSDRLALATVAPDYRLAPEHPHPAGLEDAVATIEWAADTLAPRLGVEPVVLVGSSAGAHLTALALLRLRERRPELSGRFRAVVLSYGAYDIGLSPSMRLAAPDAPVVAPAPNAAYMRWAFGDTTNEQRRSADISPLYAALDGLPPTLFTACARDPLRDDTQFMAARWRDAGNDCDLDVWPECMHGFDVRCPITAQRYHDRVVGWLARRLGEGHATAPDTP